MPASDPDPFCVCGHPAHRHSQRMAVHHTRSGGTVQQDFGIECDGCECREFMDAGAYHRSPFSGAYRRHPGPARAPTRILTEQERRLKAAEEHIAQLEAERQRTLREQWAREAAYHQQQAQRVSIRVLSDRTSPADMWVPDLPPYPAPRPLGAPQPAPVAPPLQLPAEAKRWVKRGGK